MKSEIELLVELKIPDTTAITTFHTLERLGYKNIKKIRRLEYYKFIIDGDIEEFSREIVKADILVNVNKHKYYVQKNLLKEDFFADSILVLVKNDSGDSGILSALKNSLGFKQIKEMEKGILWALYFDADKIKAKKLAEEVAKKLLVNENYQRFEVL